MSSSQLSQNPSLLVRRSVNQSGVLVVNYKNVRNRPIATQPLRQAAGLVTRKDGGRFDRALQELQTTFNIARLPIVDTTDLWVPFVQQYPQLP